MQPVVHIPIKKVNAEQISDANDILAKEEPMEIRLEYMRAHKGDLTNFEKDRQEFVKNLRQEKVSMVFNEWFRQLNTTVKIKSHLDEIERSQKGS